MTTIRPLVSVRDERPTHLAIFLSGSGSNAERILERVARHDQLPFEVVALVTDAPETSRARDLGRAHGLPVVEHDIRAFYRNHGETRVSIRTPRGQELRQTWTEQLRSKLAPFEIDVAAFAGFVPLTNLTADFPCLNVHPGDLTYLKDGQRYLVGLHTVPIERAILEGLDAMRTSVIQALPYTGKGDDMDNGPILGISGAVPIDLQGATLDELAACLEERPDRRPKGGYGDRLDAVAKANLDALKVGGDWVVLPQVVFDAARGRFGLDDAKRLHYRMGRNWHPIDTVIYEAGAHEVIFADPEAE